VRPVQSDVLEHATHSVILDPGFPLDSERLPVCVVSIARWQSLVLGLECLDVGGCDTVGLPRLLQLSKPDRIPHPCGSRINAIHIPNYESRQSVVAKSVGVCRLRPFRLLSRRSGRVPVPFRPGSSRVDDINSAVPMISQRTATTPLTECLTLGAQFTRAHGIWGHPSGGGGGAGLNDRSDAPRK